MSSTAPGPDGPGPLYQSIIGEGMGQRLRRALAFYYAAETSWKLAQRTRNNYRAKRSYTVTIHSDDDIYMDAQERVLEQMTPSRLRSLTARSHYDKSDEHESVMPVDGPPSKRKQPTVRLSYDSAISQDITIGGYDVMVSVDSSGTKPQKPGEPRRWENLTRDRMIFTVTGVAARDAVVDWLTDIARSRVDVDRAPQLSIAERWGGWNRRSEMPRRRHETVILRAGQKEDIERDLQAFLDDEDVYARLGVPWHRGYLLSGPPGTGKTSIARAIADKFKMDVWYMPLSDIAEDANLLQMVSQVKARSMLLLEDIDVVSAAKERDDTNNGITMSGLLNALDGVATPHGLLTVMTSNNASLLDPALVRAGRIDRTFEVNYLDSEQFQRLVRVMTGLEVGFPIDDGVVPAQIVETIKTHLRDDEALLAALSRFSADRGHALRP